MKKKFSIAIIPARKNSVRIKNKNIRVFNKYPIIYYSIKAALNSKCFDHVFVSTDSKKIANLSLSYGAKVPFLRSKKLSGNKISTKDVLQDFIKKIKNIHNFNYVCCLYPASPFIKIKNLKKAFQLVKRKKGLIFPVCTFSSNIERSITIGKKGKLSYDLKSFKKRSQDFKNHYYDAGQFYFGRTQDFFKKKLINNATRAIILKKYETIDINELSDWNFAQKLLKI
tara:strand:+ start:418 stop:1095 length:678 start_codon:yes stop_codon:yes gene_type:complete